MMTSPTCTFRAAAPLRQMQPLPRSPLDDVGLETLSVVDVHNLDLFALDDVGRLQKRLVDGDAAHIMQIGLRDRYAVDLGFDDFNLEFHYRIRMLSIKRMSPACTAIQP